MAQSYADLGLAALRTRDDLIVEARDTCGLTITQIGEAIGWDQPTTSRAYGRAKERRKWPNR